ncbi:MAG: methyltransferase domain-containing protein, partial [Holosporales bacterium]|nr:methyltransferase domain-containing protein [Holosporales bacterium]
MLIKPNDIEDIEIPKMQINKKDILILSREHNISQREILLLLADILGENYSTLFFKEIIKLTEHEFKVFSEGMKRLIQNEPISKIIQKREFYGIEFKTNINTLDPRPETELIVDLFQKYFADYSAILNILDLGTGTGCLGLSVIKLYKNATAKLTDISEKAINVAVENSKLLGLFDRCNFIKSNWFQELNG